ncbi:hypothetical protein FB567DRAFT_546358 [Paraphoma chrysanthemicola]|uniref:BTB domain-containing protein n=1 Tax=Paraphoma chrysanthemicola TaxID=798071 RepID=A0A8K0RDK3_9PLEO|nr:hypothetical protein FB567DRAFT_546358 [Paraphoma chrysanthemicola]
MSGPCKHTELVADMKQALETGKYSDLTIICHGRSWAVHKLIVCAQSDALEAASRFGKEAAEGIIELPDDDPEIVEHMLQYMYERDYRLPSEDVHGPHWIRPLYSTSVDLDRLHWDLENLMWRCSTPVIQMLLDRERDPLKQVNQPQSNSSEYIAALMSLAQSYSLPLGTEDLSIHAKLYAIADKFFVKGLKDAAREKFEKSIRDTFASKHFYDAVDIVFSTTPDHDAGLRDLLAERIMAEKIKFRLGNNGDLDDALKEVPGLAFRVMQCEEKRRAREDTIAK